MVYVWVPVVKCEPAFVCLLEALPKGFLSRVPGLRLFLLGGVWWRTVLLDLMMLVIIVVRSRTLTPSPTTKHGPDLAGRSMLLMVSLGGTELSCLTEGQDGDQRHGSARGI